MSEEIDRLLREHQNRLDLIADRATTLEAAARREREARIHGFIDGLCFAAVCILVLSAFALFIRALV